MGEGTGIFHKGQNINCHYLPRTKQAAQYLVGISWIVEDAYTTPEDTVIFHLLHERAILFDWDLNKRKPCLKTVALCTPLGP